MKWSGLFLFFFVFFFVLCASFMVRAEVEVGDRPQVELEDLDGEEVKLSDHRGEVVIVDLWATWCEPCRASMPFYQRLYEEHRDRGLRILAISVDENQSAVEAFRRRHGLGFSILLDEDHRTAEEFRPPTMPTAYLVDRDGVVRYRHSGFGDGDREEIERRVLELLGE